MGEYCSVFQQTYCCNKPDEEETERRRRRPRSMDYHPPRLTLLTELWLGLTACCQSSDRERPPRCFHKSASVEEIDLDDSSGTSYAPSQHIPPAKLLKPPQWSTKSNEQNVAQETDPVPSTSQRRKKVVSILPIKGLPIVPPPPCRVLTNMGGVNTDVSGSVLMRTGSVLMRTGSVLMWAVALLMRARSVLIRRGQY